jgi:hypothetical protein
MDAHNPSSTAFFFLLPSFHHADAGRHPRTPVVVRLRTQETGVQGALGAQRTGTRCMPLQPQANIPHLPRGNMGRGEISLSTTDDLKPKTEGGSWMGSGKWPTAKKRERRPNDQTSEVNECLRPIKRSGLCTLTARGALYHCPAVGTTKSTLQYTCVQHASKHCSSQQTKRTIRKMYTRHKMFTAAGTGETHRARRSAWQELSSDHPIAHPAMHQGSRKESARRQSCCSLSPLVSAPPPHASLSRAPCRRVSRAQ